LSLVVAVILVIVALMTAGADGVVPLSELQLGAIGGALALVIFGVQGLLSIALEGEELRPGTMPPHLTHPLTAAIVIASLLLLLDAVVLGYGIVAGWSTGPLGLAAAAGCLLLATLLIFYKEAFLGDEARLDDREDGIPW
jgi:hypothetical protein